jgi:glucosamine--fructose-6-phosphate aminotransferase (isomerizing)
VEKIAERFYSRTDFLFLGRGINYPIALEGALKLKEISYIHAEGYPAGEMKHGPIALIDERMPVVAICARRPRVREDGRQRAGGQGARRRRDRDHDRRRRAHDGGARPEERRAGAMPRTSALLTPIVMTIPLQLLAYYIAVRRGCDVDQPRNLAKSVTVE